MFHVLLFYQPPLSVPEHGLVWPALRWVSVPQVQVPALSSCPAVGSPRVALFTPKG